MHTKADDVAGELAHDHEYPVAIQNNGLTPEQVKPPQAVFGVPDESQPRWSSITWAWPEMRSKDASYHIFIDIGSKRFIDLLCDPWAAKTRVALLYFDDVLNCMLD